MYQGIPTSTGYPTYPAPARGQIAMYQFLPQERTGYPGTASYCIPPSSVPGYTFGQRLGAGFGVGSTPQNPAAAGMMGMLGAGQMPMTAQTGALANRALYHTGQPGQPTTPGQQGTPGTLDPGIASQLMSAIVGLLAVILPFILQQFGQQAGQQPGGQPGQPAQPTQPAQPSQPSQPGQPPVHVASTGQVANMLPQQNPLLAFAGLQQRR